MVSTDIGVACCCDNIEFARELANELGKPLMVDPDRRRAGFVLEVTDAGLQLRDLGNRRYRPLRLDFDRNRYSPSSHNLLKRALGSGVESVVDATAGWACDALQLVHCGLQVTALERDAVVAAMLNDAWRRCQDPMIRGNLHILKGDSIEMLSSLKTMPDAIYMDPMFPQKRKKTAAARKEMVILQRLADREEDATELLASAIRAARCRVVVKRPSYAPPLGGSLPAGSVAGKLVRFDIYSAAS